MRSHGNRPFCRAWQNSMKSRACMEKILGCTAHTPDSLGQYETVSEPILSLYSCNECMEGLIFGVHFDLLQIVLCMQLPCSADWGTDRPISIGYSGRGQGIKFFKNRTFS